MEIVFCYIFNIFEGEIIMSIQLKRIYESANKNDGIRVLVDRIWPRGVSKDKAKLDYWLKGIGPSTKLRKDFNHDPEKFADFKEKYKQELKNGEQKEQLNQLKDIVKSNSKVTLLYGAKDEQHNQAVILKELLEK